MKRIIPVSALLMILVFSSTTDAQETVSANPTRPSASDNAYLTAYGYAEIEFGWAKREDAWSLPTILKFSVHRRIELGLTMDGLLNHTQNVHESKTELGDPGLQIKAQLLRSSRGALALVGHTGFPENANTEYTFYAVGSTHTKRIAIDVTLGGRFSDSGNGKDRWAVFYAVAVALDFKSPLSGFVEIFGEATSGQSPSAMDFGFSYAVSPGFVADISAALALNSAAPDWQWQVGFTTVLARLFG